MSGGHPGAGPAPTVSVVIPTYNAEAAVLDALASVVSQTYTDWEILVCDDGSTDGTRAVAERYLAAQEGARWRILSLERGGPAETRNRGVREARGEWIAFLDDDDGWAPQKLQRCMEAVGAGRLDVVGHSEAWVDDAGRSRPHHYSALFDASVHPLVSLMRANPFSTSALVVRRSALLEAGLFDPQLPSAEDYDLWIRLAMLPEIRIGFIDEVLGTYRLRAGSESSRIDRRMRALLTIGARYGDALAAVSRLGRLESWMFRSKTYFTSGLRLLRQGSPGRGAGLVAIGLLMWPFRFDWIRFAQRQRATRAVPAGS
jgi:glycosyltransferase involved in cell wall biosynthesis